MAKESPKAKKKIKKVIKEYSEGKLHSGSKKGPMVKDNPKQAIAIALSEARKKGMKVPSKKKVNSMVKNKIESVRKAERDVKHLTKMKETRILGKKHHGYDVPASEIEKKKQSKSVSKSKFKVK